MRYDETLNAETVPGVTWSIHLSSCMIRIIITTRHAPHNTHYATLLILGVFGIRPNRTLILSKYRIHNHRRRPDAVKADVAMNRDIVKAASCSAYAA